MAKAKPGRPITSAKIINYSKFSRNYLDVHVAMKRESSAKVSEMLKWEKWQRDHDVESMYEMYHDEGIFALIEEARLINGRLHDRTRYWTAAKDKITGLQGAIDGTRFQIAEATKRLADLTDLEEIDTLQGKIVEAEKKVLAWEDQIPLFEDRMDEVESAQWELSRQVTKLFCTVHKKIIELGGGDPRVVNAEERDAFEEYEYDPEIAS